MEKPNTTLIYRITVIWKKLISSSPEGRIFMAGVVLALCYIFGLGICWLLSPKKFQILIGLTATSILFGRAAALSFGYTMGLGHRMVIPVTMLIETVIVAIFFPLFVFTLQKLVVIKALNKTVARINKAAEEKREIIRKYGMLGLFFFVWFPFWMTGPVVGSVIGFLLGMKPWINIAVVMSGSYIAIACWAVFLKGLHDKVAEFNPYVPMIMLFAIIVIVIIGHILHAGYFKNRAHKK